MGKRRDDLPAARRAELGLAMVSPYRPWGEVSRLAWEQGLSRTTLYTLGAKTWQVLLEGLQPGPYGPRQEAPGVAVDRNRLRRSLVMLTEAGVWQRDIQTCLEEMLDTAVSLGWVNGQLAQIKAQAAAVNAGWQPSVGEDLAADELFAYGRAHLVVIGNESWYVYALTPQPHRDGDTWGCVLLEMPESDQIATDGGSGLAAGLGAAARKAQQQLDWGHLLRLLWRQDTLWEQRAYAALITLYAREADFFQAKTEGRLAQHLRAWDRLRQEAEDAIGRYDTFHQIARQIDAEFAMFDPDTGAVRDPQTSQERLQALGEQLRTISDPLCHRIGTSLLHGVQGLVHYLPRLAQALLPLCQTGGEQALRALCRLWQAEADTRRGHLPEPERQTKEALWATSLEEAEALLGGQLFGVWEALSAILNRLWRGSMAAEGFNSLFLPWVRAHHHTDAASAELFRFLHNTHRFARGKQAGSSPAERVGLAVPLDRLTLLGLAPKAVC